MTLSLHEVEKQEASLQISLTLSKQERNSRASIIFLCQWITQIIKTEVSRIIIFRKTTFSDSGTSNLSIITPESAKPF